MLARFVPVSAIALGVLLGGGCATYPRHVASAAPSALDLPLDGLYDATLHTEFAGAVTFRLAASPAPGGFEASTRPGVAWSFVGGLEGFLGRIFAPYFFPGGVLVTWTSDLPAGLGPGAGTMRAGQVPGAAVRTALLSADMPIDVFATDGRRVGLLTLSPSKDPDAPLADYPALAASLEKALRERWYRLDESSGPSIDAFHDRVRDVALMARDDLEFLFGLAMAARAHLSTVPAVPTRVLDAAVASAVRMDRAFARLTPSSAPAGAPLGDRAAVLRIDALLDLDELERARVALMELDPPALILDLRTCGGVDPRALVVLSWFLEGERTIAWGVGPAHRESAEADALADVASHDVADARLALDAGAPARLIVAGRSDRFDPPLVVLVSRRTVGMPEVVAWTLQREGRARVIGETTTGRALIYEPVPLIDGWEAHVPTMELVRAPGEMDSRVRPDIACARERAPTAARRALSTGLEH